MELSPHSKCDTFNSSRSLRGSREKSFEPTLHARSRDPLRVPSHTHAFSTDLILPTKRGAPRCKTAVVRPGPRLSSPPTCPRRGGGGRGRRGGRASVYLNAPMATHRRACVPGQQRGRRREPDTHLPQPALLHPPFPSPRQTTFPRPYKMTSEYKLGLGSLSMTLLTGVRDP